MLDVEPIINVAREAERLRGNINKTEDGRQFIINEAGNVIFLTSRKEDPQFIAGQVQFHEGNSLAEYAKKYAGPASIFIADIVTNCVMVKLDYHEPGKPSHNVHTAFWPMPVSEEFRIWSALNGKWLSQDQFLQHLEENFSEIVNPAPTAILDLVRDFQAVKTTVFRQATNRGNGDRVFQYTEDSQVKGEIVIPKKITLEMPIYRGEQPVRFDAFFRTKITDGGLMLQYEFHRIEPIKQAAFRLAVTRVAEAAGMVPLYGVA